MKKALNGLVLTLAGVGLLTGSRAEDPSALHDRVRTRVLGAVGDRGTPAAGRIREALSGDPDFARSLARCGRGALAGLSREQNAEDALEEALLKIWRGRPEVFLLPHDELVRYLRAATARNLATAARREAGCRGAPLEDPGELPASPSVPGADPASEAAARDLVEELCLRLDPSDRAVLATRLRGLRSERSVAAATGLSRHAVSASTRRIRRAMRILGWDPCS